METRWTRAMARLAVLCAASLAWAQDPDWSGMSWTTHAAYQAVTGSGAGAFPLDAEVRMRGIILNRAEDMLDVAPNSDPFMGGQWQVTFQAVDEGDFGGTMLWMGQNIGKPKGTHPAGSYTVEEYLAEINRLSHDPETGRAFRTGDLIEVRARAPGLFYRGKTNINEAHSKLDFNNFDVVLIRAGEGLPQPAAITLADLKNHQPGPTLNTFRFDATRASGPEHYQGAAVRLENVWFVDPAGWQPYGQLAVTDGTLTLPVQLGRGTWFGSYPAPSGPFNIVGILDQEDTIATDGFKDGYRLWVLGYDGLRFYLPGQELAPADFDGDGDVDQADFGHLQRCFTGPEETATPICSDADFDKDRSVDAADLEAFVGCASGPFIPADPDCLSVE